MAEGWSVVLNVFLSFSLTAADSGKCTTIHTTHTHETLVANSIRHVLCESVYLRSSSLTSLSRCGQRVMYFVSRVWCDIVQALTHTCLVSVLSCEGFAFPVALFVLLLFRFLFFPFYSMDTLYLCQGTTITATWTIVPFKNSWNLFVKRELTVGTQILQKKKVKWTRTRKKNLRFN